jgi:hypothetical protein
MGEGGWGGETKRGYVFLETKTMTIASRRRSKSHLLVIVILISPLSNKKTMVIRVVLSNAISFYNLFDKLSAARKKL